jgi:hypothetical protein
LVLGDKFVQQTQARKNVFAKFKDEEETVSEYEDKTIYSLVDPFLLGIEDFRSIYL